MTFSLRDKRESLLAEESFSAASDFEIEGRKDGTLILKSSEPLAPYARCLGNHLVNWARNRPNEIFHSQRGDDGTWLKLTWLEAYEIILRLSAMLLERKLSPSRPVAILSENSIAYALMQLAAMHVGIPVVPISPSYALRSQDFNKLKKVFALLTPGLLMVEDAVRYSPALQALRDFNFETVSVKGNTAPSSLQQPKFVLYDELLKSRQNDKAVEQALAAITPQTIAKFLLTSGSTGEPKPVINTQRMLCSNQQAAAQVWKFLAEDDPPVVVDWLPWHHTFGGNFVFNLVVTQGGTLYVDNGKPTDLLIKRTISNLEEISPTVYFNTPHGYSLLLPHLERDAVLRAKFFARLKLLKWAGATLTEDAGKRLRDLSLKSLGNHLPICAGWGATETAPTVTLSRFGINRANAIGLPIPGCELKMMPLAVSGKYELRVRGPNVTPGYWHSPKLTDDAFDDEGFYKTGDIARFADIENLSQGLVFAGRMTENFKLSTGIWVNAEELRKRALAILAPLARELVVTGENRDEIGLLIFADEAGCRSFCDRDQATSFEELIFDSQLSNYIREVLQRLKTAGGINGDGGDADSGANCGRSIYAARALILSVLPDIQAGEITEKGSLNIPILLERRASSISKLYDDRSINIIRI